MPGPFPLAMFTCQVIEWSTWTWFWEGTQVSPTCLWVMLPSWPWVLDPHQQGPGRHLGRSKTAGTQLSLRHTCLWSSYVWSPLHTYTHGKAEVSHEKWSLCIKIRLSRRKLSKHFLKLGKEKLCWTGQCLKSLFEFQRKGQDNRWWQGRGIHLWGTVAFNGHICLQAPHTWHHRTSRTPPRQSRFLEIKENYVPFRCSIGYEHQRCLFAKEQNKTKSPKEESL